MSSAVLCLLIWLADIICPKEFSDVFFIKQHWQKAVLVGIFVYELGTYSCYIK